MNVGAATGHFGVTTRITRVGFADGWTGAVAIGVLVYVAAAIWVTMASPVDGLVERLGKYNRYANPGFHVIIPVVERMFQVDIREMLVEAEPQTIIRIIAGFDHTSDESQPGPVMPNHSRKPLTKPHCGWSK